MAQDQRPFNVKNVGNPKMDIIERAASKVSAKPDMKFTIPKNMGAANNPKRK